jgi:hypothetical protein
MPTIRLEIKGSKVARPDFLQLVGFGKRLRNEIPTYDYDDSPAESRGLLKRPLFPSGAVVRGSARYPTLLPKPAANLSRSMTEQIPVPAIKDPLLGIGV